MSWDMKPQSVDVFENCTTLEAGDVLFYVSDVYVSRNSFYFLKSEITWNSM